MCLYTVNIFKHFLMWNFRQKTKSCKIEIFCCLLMGVHMKNSQVFILDVFTFPAHEQITLTLVFLVCLSS